ncbi:MAG: DNRLRE domain-containing protein [Verrucomicrobiaceae bacterium]|nr:DNRLRE domain-containing protein [Verrucomicrobiaceae bacterium]
MNPEAKWKLLELWERARDGRTSDEETHELNERIKTDAEARAFMAEAVFLEAELRTEMGEDSGIRIQESGRIQQSVERQVARRTWFSLRTFTAAAAAAIVAGGAMWLLQREPAPVATLVKARQCKWGNSALPTLEGGLLKPGALELVEGMATLKFRSGAEVVMEAPVSLEVVSAMECRIKRGTIVADVPPQAKGFTVQTPDTKVVDFGTRFGVSTSEDGKCLVHVIKGLVEVNRKDPGETRKLTTGERADFGGMVKSQVSGIAAAADQPEPDRWLPGPISDMGDGWQMLTTAFGLGRDSCIQSSDVKITGAEPFLRVKHTTLDPKLERKGYVAFDLSHFAGKKVADAEFVLHIEPSDLGFASLVPDATFDVYGLTDETQDGWTEDGLAWANAPAHDLTDEHHSLPIASATKLLGRFTIPQGTTRGSFSIKGDDLVSFLNADTDSLVTLIICRETDETARNGLVHAFATKENSRTTPPVLRLKIVR